LPRFRRCFRRHHGVTYRRTKTPLIARHAEYRLPNLRLWTCDGPAPLGSRNPHHTGQLLRRPYRRTRVWKKGNIGQLTSQRPVNLGTLSQRYSSWTKLLRITAYIKKFIDAIRTKQGSTSVTSQSPTHVSLLSPSEIQDAETFWLKSIQMNLFPVEFLSLSNATPIPTSSQLLSLHPFLDDQQLIRVGGRLRHADIPKTSRHPVILKDHPLVRVIIRSTQLQALHAGPQLTLSILREKYWILRARSLIRVVLHRCIVCTRERALIPCELMGDLPSVRVNRSTRAFAHTGVDYAGPIFVRTAKGRGHKANKAYISLFICMTVKAIHLELVSDYSADAFIAAFQRFVSRRGYPTSVYSDNGTTFQGADRELRTAARLVTEDPNFINNLASEGIKWHFLPPSAPYFGGLWEAAVRSMKHHLKRCIGSHMLTFEELTTVICRIEGGASVWTRLNWTPPTTATGA